MERKEITAKELCNMIKEKVVDSAKNKTSYLPIEVENYEVTDFVNSFPASIFGRVNSRPYRITIIFKWCEFNRGITIENVSKKEIHLSFENCTFANMLSIGSNPDAGNVTVNVNDCKIKGTEPNYSGIVQFNCVKKITLSKFVANRLKINYERWLDTASFDLFDVSAFHIKFSGQQKLRDVNISCHEDLIAVIARFFPITPFREIWTWSNYRLGQKH